MTQPHAGERPRRKAARERPEVLEVTRRALGAGTGTGTDTDADADADTRTDADADTRTDADTDADANTGANKRVRRIPPEDLPAPEPPLTLAEEGGAPVPLARFYSDIVYLCLDQIAALARSRLEGALLDKAGAEARILAQMDAIATAGGNCVADILSYWEQSLESPSRYGTWASAFALACLAGAESLDAALTGIERLPPDAAIHGALAAEALAVAPHPSLMGLCSKLTASAHPIARAAALEILSLRGALPIEILRLRLDDESAPVRAAAARAAGRLDAIIAEPLASLLVELLRVPDPSVAWPAARALSLWGYPEPYEEVRSGGPLSATLGAQALEIFVLRGEGSDAARFEAIVARRRVTANHLDAIARFGHPGTWAFLAHHLEQPDLADAAADALATLFGDRVDPDERTSAPAWTSAIRKGKFDPSLRYRRGEPWRPGAVAAECASGLLSRIAVEKRLDELTARARIASRPELFRWQGDAAPALAQALDEASRADGLSQPGAW
jgi:hypothetical protein